MTFREAAPAIVTMLSTGPSHCDIEVRLSTIECSGGATILRTVLAYLRVARSKLRIFISALRSERRNTSFRSDVRRTTDDWMRRWLSLSLLLQWIMNRHRRWAGIDQVNLGPERWCLRHNRSKCGKSQEATLNPSDP
jgi:hypothetical protein